MQDDFYNNLKEQISNLKDSYEKARKDNINPDLECFKVEEKLYKFIKKYFTEYFESKIGEAETYIKHHKEIWEFILRKKEINSCTLPDNFSEEDLKIIHNINDKKLRVYYNLYIFAKNKFNKEKILSEPEPHAITFSMFRFSCPVSDFDIIIEDLQNYLIDNSTKNEYKHIKAEIEASKLNIKKEKYRLTYYEAKTFQLNGEAFLINSPALSYRLHLICIGDTLIGNPKSISSDVSRINAKAKEIIHKRIIHPQRDRINNKTIYVLENYIIYIDKAETKL